MTVTEIIIDYLKARVNLPITKDMILSELPNYGIEKFKILYSDTDYAIKFDLLFSDKELLTKNRLIIGDVLTKNSQKGFYIREL